ncbi:MAG TPA: response regulator [Candidatus Baltobacteraceae bacterium]|nr:response regulator [Candidatus Baltobacteraceae bacterium]
MKRPPRPDAILNFTMARNVLLVGQKMDTLQDALQGKRILLVDDERSVRETVRRLLCHDEHEVVEANNGAEALRIFAQDQFDLVLTDLRMPFVEGDELAVKIRKISPQQPILMITAHTHKPCRSNPVDAVLYKPFHLDDLRRAVAKLLTKLDDCPDPNLCPR